MTRGYYGSSDLPEAFLDLSEVNEPSPVSNPSPERDVHQRASSRNTVSRTSIHGRHPSASNRTVNVVSPISNRQSRASIRSVRQDARRHDDTLPRSTTPQHSRAPSTATQHELYDRAHDYMSRYQNQSYHGHLTDIASPTAKPPSPSDRRSSDEKGTQTDAESHIATKLYTLSYLIFFSIWGTLARLGLQALTIYPNAPVTQSVLWANVGGSFVMGLLSEDRKLFQTPWGPTATMQTKLPEDEQKKRYMAMKKTIPLYVGLSTGFCGCFTSFSSWQRDAFLALANIPGSNTFGASTARNGGYSAMALLATLILTPGLCLAALQCGAHVALFLHPITPGFNYRLIRKVLDPFVVFLGFGAWIGAIILAILPPDRPYGPSGHATWLQESWRGDAIFACVFAPAGCLTRFYASVWLNGRIPTFPLGTFFVNIFGSVVLAVCYDLQRAPLVTGVGGGFVSCQILQGVMDGYCGSTTTISTWVSELKGLRRRHAYVYGLVSTFAALGCMVAIMGGLYWTRGYERIACVT